MILIKEENHPHHHVPTMMVAAAVVVVVVAVFPKCKRVEPNVPQSLAIRAIQ
jgi:hypothetical protein